MGLYRESEYPRRGKSYLLYYSEKLSTVLKSATPNLDMRAKSVAVHLFTLRWPIKWFVWVLLEVPQIKYLLRNSRRSGFPCVSWGVAGMAQESFLLLVLAHRPEFKMARQEGSVQDLGQTSGTS